MTTTDDRDLEKIRAAAVFRNTLVDKADANRGGAALWHGWAIMDAFLAGVRWAEANRAQEARSDAPHESEPAA